MPELRPRPRCVRAIGRRRGRCNPAVRPIPVRFADDSPVEGMGFEPSVPPRLGAFTPSKTSMSGSVGVGGFEKGEFEGNSATEKVAAQIGVRGPIRSNSARRKSFSGLPALSNGSLDRAGFRRSQKPRREWEHWRVAGLRHRRGPDHSHRKQCCSRQSDDLAAGPRPNFVAATPRRDEKSRQRTEHPIKSTKLNSREVGNARNGRDDDRCDYG